MSSRHPFTLDRVVRLVIGIIITVGLLWLIYTLRTVLLPFFVAALIAYIFEPFVQFNRRLLHLRGRSVAIFVTLFEAIFFIGVACYFLIPLISGEMSAMADVLRRYTLKHHELRVLPQEVHNFLLRNVDFNRISDILARQDWGGMIQRFVSSTWDIITGSVMLIAGVVSWFIVVLYVIFIMLDYDRINRGFHNMVPPKYRKITYKVMHDVKDSMNHYFRGQALVALIVGILFSIGFYIIGLPMAIVLGLFIGVLNLVPYLQLISIIPTTLLCVVYAAGGGSDFWSIFWQAMAVYVVVQIIQDFFLTPKIMGKAMGLNPALILLSLSVWGSLLGLIGLIIALPATTLLLSYYNEYIIGRNENDGDTPAEAEAAAETVKELEESPLD